MGLIWAAYERDAIRRGGYAEFIRRAWHTFDPAPLTWGPAQEQMARHVQAQWHLEIRDLLINVPPGSSKSTIATICVAPWVWTLDPSAKFMFASYGQTLSTALARKALQIVQSDWYIDRWGDILNPEQTAAGNMATKARGHRIATSVQGTATGLHCNWFGVDDPIKPPDPKAKVKSSLKSSDIERAANFMHHTVATRIAEPASEYRRTLTMQRLHELDPSQLAIDEGWTHLCLPMRYDPDRPCATPVGGDWRTERDEVLEPKRRPRAVLDQAVKGVLGWGSDIESAQWQQRPSPAGGLVFKRDTFKRFDIGDHPFAAMGITAISVDCAFKATETSDHVAIEVWGMTFPDFYLFDSVCERLNFGDTIGRILDVRKRWPVDVILIEDKANGSAVIELLKRTIPNVVAFSPKGSKLDRAHSAEYAYRSGNVYHRDVSEPWLATKEFHLTAFPRGAVDDDVDATSQAIIWFQTEADHSILRVPAGAWAALRDDLAARS
jgi:predicted phage terminase large subunit-like protein